jgi:hypothetical protein
MVAYNILSRLKPLTTPIAREQKTAAQTHLYFQTDLQEYKHSLVIDTVLCNPLVASITTRKSDVRGPCAAHNMHSRQRGMKSTLACYKKIIKNIKCLKPLVK